MPPRRAQGYDDECWERELLPQWQVVDERGILLSELHLHHQTWPQRSPVRNGPWLGEGMHC